MTQFDRYIGIDYSGAQSSDSRLRGLKIFECTSAEQAEKQVPEAENPSWNWTRRSVYDFVRTALDSDEKVIIGIDHAFSFPLAYFVCNGLLDWDNFIDDFVRYWPTLEQRVDDVREDNPRSGSIDEFRLTEKRTGSAQSVFKLDGAGTVGKSTHTGIPHLRNLRREFGATVHFWPFDGWQIPTGKSAIVEVYPRLFLNSYATDTWGPNKDERDARVVAEFLRDADRSGRLEPLLNPELTRTEKSTAELEGWILGVM